MAKRTADGAGSVEEFSYGGSRYRKIVDGHTGKMSLYLDGRPLSVAEWNRAVNRHQPMRNKARHPFAPVRYLERARRRRIVKLVAPRRDERGADIGCEQGHLTAALAAGGAAVTGFDLDPAVLAAARQSSPDDCSYAVGDVASLPLKSDALDFCLCAETLEHVRDPAGALLELRRVLRPGGRLVVTVPNEQWILFLKKVLRVLGLRRLLGSLSPGLAMGHLQSFTPRSLRNLMPEGLGIVRLFRDKPFFLNVYCVVEKK